MDRERTTLYLLFITDEEIERIKLQESEVEDIEWSSIDEEIKIWKRWKLDKKNSGVCYAGFGIFVLEDSTIVDKLKKAIKNQ